MCGRFEQSGTRRYYASALRIDTSNERESGLAVILGVLQCRAGLNPGMIVLDKGSIQFLGRTWGYRTPQEALLKKKPWINARIEKALTGHFSATCFGEADPDSHRRLVRDCLTFWIKLRQRAQQYWRQASAQDFGNNKKKDVMITLYFAHQNQNQDYQHQ